jgi:transcriptional regulator with XRE-family HTH domain
VVKKQVGRGRPRKRETVLSRWIDEAGKTREEVAQRLFIARTYLDRICRGERRPGLELAIEIEQLTGGAVPVEVWKRVPPHRRD